MENALLYIRTVKRFDQLWSIGRIHNMTIGFQLRFHSRFLAYLKCLCDTKLESRKKPPLQAPYYKGFP